MRHIIAHLIRGEAQTLHEVITQDLADRFDNFPIHKRIRPHLTLKRWFEPGELGLEELYGLLDTYAKREKRSDYKLGGFGHFEKDVIYMDITPSAEMGASARNLMKDLHMIKEMRFDQYDLIENLEDDLHATVAMSALKPFDFDSVWKYVNDTYVEQFAMHFDNIAVLKREKDVWEVDRVWELGD